MDKLFSGQSGKIIFGALAVVVGMIIFGLFVEKSKWYQEQKAKS